jgi:hypothetical protein
MLESFDGVYSEANDMTLACTEMEQIELQFPTDKQLS